VVWIYQNLLCQRQNAEREHAGVETLLVILVRVRVLVLLRSTAYLEDIFPGRSEGLRDGLEGCPLLVREPDSLLALGLGPADPVRPYAVAQVSLPEVQVPLHRLLLVLYIERLRGWADGVLAY